MLPMSARSPTRSAEAEPDEVRLNLISRSPEETRELGAQLASLVQPGDVLALSGDLGTGKTTLIQGLARGLGITQPVTSPTFILINEYRSSPPLYHVDCYRLEDAPAEAQAIGLEELLSGDGVCVIEWADRLRELLPAERLEIRFRWVDARVRHIEIRGYGARYGALVRALQARRSPAASAR